MKTTQQAIKTAPCRISLSMAVIFGCRRLLLFSVVALAESYVSECCVDTSKEGEMIKAQKSLDGVIFTGKHEMMET